MRELQVKILRYLRYDTLECLRMAAHELLALNFNVYTDHNNYLLAVPRGAECLPVIVTAHVDTVPRNDANLGMKLSSDGIITSNGILGGDDRCGVAIAMQMAHSLQVKPVILLTNGEETGFWGMQAFLNTGLLDKLKEDIRLYVGLDRRGLGEAISYCAINKELAEYAEGFGFKVSRGISNSDVSLLSKATNISHLNLSVGYYGAHTSKESVNLEDLYLSYEGACQIVQGVHQTYVVPYEEPKKITYTPKQRMYAMTKKIAERVLPAVPWDTAHGSAVQLPPSCDMCGKNTRPTKLYEALGGVHLCNVCRARIFKYGELSLVNYAKAFEDLERVRNTTRRANKAKTMRDIPKGMIPLCPVCNKNNRAEFDETTCGFICHRCHNSDTCPDYDGHYWLQGDVRVYVRGSTVLRAEKDHNKLLHFNSIATETYIRQCESCKMHTVQPRILEQGTKQKVLCRFCYQREKALEHKLRHGPTLQV